MIQDKDASKSDERHVKNRRNTNLLTQRNTGGKHIMGNRGMTNWKLGAFFVMSLMLVAAVFSNAAMAAANDGEGKVTVGWGPRTSGTIDTTAQFVEGDLDTAVSVETMTRVAAAAADTDGV